MQVKAVSMSQYTFADLSIPLGIAAVVGLVAVFFLVRFIVGAVRHKKEPFAEIIASRALIKTVYKKRDSVDLLAKLYQMFPFAAEKYPIDIFHSDTPEAPDLVAEMVTSAKQVASSAGDREAQPIHLFIAVLMCTKCAARGVLEENGANVGVLTEAALEHLADLRQKAQG